MTEAEKICIQKMQTNKDKALSLLVCIFCLQIFSASVIVVLIINFS